MGIAVLTGTYAFLTYIGSKKKNRKNIDDDNAYLDDSNFECQRKVGWYEGKFKPALDKVLSFAGLLILAPLYSIISLANKDIPNLRKLIQGGFPQYPSHSCDILLRIGRASCRERV